MSFNVYIYYCALMGGWAAFLAWAIIQFTGIAHIVPLWLRAGLTGGVLGLLVAAAVGWMDALLNAVGPQRFLRLGVCASMGLIGGTLGGLLGQVISGVLGQVLPDSLKVLPMVFGWILAGTLIGSSVGMYDLFRAFSGGEDWRVPLKKTFNGVYGGLLGGFIGGLPFTFLLGSKTLPNSSLTISLVILGACIGLLVGLAQVVLKEAWLKVEEGFRAGRELMLTKDEVTIGRAESCDLGLFGDNTIEKLHTRILLKNNRYLVSHAGDTGQTFLNDQAVSKPMPLRTGDRIRVGKSVLVFGERQKRK